MKKTAHIVLILTICFLSVGCASTRLVSPVNGSPHISTSGAIVGALGMNRDGLNIVASLPYEFFIFADNAPVCMVTPEKPARLELKTYAQWGQTFHLRADATGFTPSGERYLLGHAYYQFTATNDGYPHNETWVIRYIEPIRR